MVHLGFRIVDGVLFEFRDVTVANADGSTRIDGLDAVIPDHGVTVIAGPSGSGKSTMLRLCNRLEAATSGTVLYRGEPIEQTDPLELRREVAMVFQRAVALRGSVADNLRTGVPGATDAIVERMLERVGLAGFAQRVARDLSGGEIQRMALARALLTEPGYVLFDEPTSSLDPAAVSAIEDLAVRLTDQGIPSAWVTHDLDQMLRLAHHVIIVIDGAVAQQGDLDDLLADPSAEVRQFLGGRSHGDNRVGETDPEED
jgi:putative ABC transport system ATP-binding protein